MAGLDGTFEIAGKKIKKKTAVIAAVGVGGIGAVMWWRKRASANATTASTTSATSGTMQTDPAGNQCVEFDPVTGYCPGTPADASAQAQADQFGTAGIGVGSFGGDGSAETCFDANGDPIDCQGSGGAGNFTTNAQWTQAAEQLMGSNGADAIAAALGKYVNGAPVTATQTTTIQEAIAAENYPPVPGTDGYPPHIRTTGGGGGGGGSGGKPSSAPTNLHTADVKETSAVLGWNKVTGAVNYRITYSENNGKGGTEQKTATTSRLSYTLHGLNRGTDHTWQVAAHNAAGYGPESAINSFRTVGPVIRRK